MAENPINMPYFIKDSLNLSLDDKKNAYDAIITGCKAMLEGETNLVTKMATINSMLKIHLPYAYWVGFYCVENEKLKVGPYQGTIGCIDIDFGKGVCGKVAVTKETEIVGDVHALTEGEGHITCDPNSRSEIVVPVFNADKDLIAVLDIDSTLEQSFDETDKAYLEKLLQALFA